MKMIHVQSSNLVAVGYDNGTLVIEFHSGTYEYRGVPANIYQGLMAASSHGEYHARYIKNSYQYKRIR